MRVFKSHEEYNDLVRIYHKKYGIELDNNFLDNFSLAIKVTVFFLGIIIGNILFHVSILFIPLWVAIGYWLEGFFEYYSTIIIPERKIKKIEKQKKEEETKKLAEKNAEDLKKKMAEEVFTYDKIIEIIEKYAGKNYPKAINPMVQDFFSQVILFCGEMQAHDVDPNVYFTFFKNHFTQIFDILSDGSKENISNNIDLAKRLIGNLSKYIESEAKRVCSEKNIDDISTLQAFANFYDQGNNIYGG